MDTTENAHNILSGDKLYQKRAKEILPILVRQAKAGQVIYYSDLAEECNIPNPRNLNYPLGSIGDALKVLGKKMRKAIPQIQCIVVNKSTDLPGEGIAEYIDKDDFKKMKIKDKRRIVEQKLTEIFVFSEWEEVLHELKLQPLENSDILQNHLEKARRYSSSGESEQHKSLKEYIAKHPSVVGINIAINKAETEFSFPSADTIDIMLQSQNEYIGIEVKSEISQSEDIVRGLFQCIKYQALLDAFLTASGLNIDSRVILALGSEFPAELYSLKNVLGINVIDNINTKIGDNI